MWRWYYLLTLTDIKSSWQPATTLRKMHSMADATLITGFSSQTHSRTHTWMSCSSFSFCSRRWLVSADILSRSFTTRWCSNLSWADRSRSLEEEGKNMSHTTLHTQTLKAHTTVILVVPSCACCSVNYTILSTPPVYLSILQHILVYCIAYLSILQCVCVCVC